MEWLNAARRDPVATLDGLLGLAGCDATIAAFLAGEAGVSAGQLEQNLQSAWTVAQNTGAQFPGSAAISTAPLAFYPLFQQQAAAWSAKAHLPQPDAPQQQPIPDYLYPTPVQDILLSGPSNVLSGPNATGGTATFGPYGATYSEVSQANLYDPAITGREYVLSLLCQPGSGSPAPAFLRQGDALPNLTLGHTRMAGIDISPASGSGRTLTVFQGSDEFFTQDDLPFGAAGTVFITGVAFQDNNSNQVYDPGEGIANVRICPDRGSWCAVTASAGGYAIPVPANSGPYTLTATGGPFAGATATVAVGSDNVKADWVAPSPPPVPPAQIPVPAPDGATQLVGLSARGLVQTGESALIGGFVVSGPSSARKSLLVRGVGPSLQTVNFPASECIPATQIQVHQGGTVIAANAGWTNAPDGGAAAARAAAEVGDFPLLDWAGGGGDSAIVISLAPGAYTVVLSPAAGMAPVFQTGHVGLVEIYDLSPGDGSRLANVSARGLVDRNDDQLIAGCTLSGGGHERLLIRAAGPALGQFGLSGTLPSPALTLHDGSTNAIASNDGASLSPQTDQIRALGAAVGAFPFPAGGADAALLALAAPGNYTAVVGAKPGTAFSGLALVELYEAP